MTQVALVGTTFLKPYGKYILGRPIPNPGMEGAVAVPEKYAAPYGKGQTGLPYQVVEILAVGPKVPGNELKAGDKVVLDPLNVETEYEEGGDRCWLFLIAAIRVKLD